MKAGKREDFGRKESGIDSNAAARKAAALWYSIGILRSGGVHAATGHCAQYHNSARSKRSRLAVAAAICRHKAFPSGEGGTA